MEEDTLLELLRTLSATAEEGAVLGTSNETNSSKLAASDEAMSNPEGQMCLSKAEEKALNRDAALDRLLQSLEDRTLRDVELSLEVMLAILNALQTTWSRRCVYPLVNCCRRP
eukprot:1136513-Pleurochrysis_carterae.AAC.2